MTFGQKCSPTHQDIPYDLLKCGHASVLVSNDFDILPMFYPFGEPRGLTLGTILTHERQLLDYGTNIVLCSPYKYFSNGLGSLSNRQGMCEL